MQFDQPGGHHHQVGHYLVRADKFAQRVDHLGHVHPRVLNQFKVGSFGIFAPVPGIFVSGDLRLRILPALVFELNVVGTVGVERWVEVGQVDGFIRNIFAQNIQVIAVEKCVFRDRFVGHGSSFALIAIGLIISGMGERGAEAQCLVFGDPHFFALVISTSRARRNLRSNMLKISRYRSK